MTTTSSILITIGVQLLFAVSPSPFRLATMRTVVSTHGRSCGIATSLGIALGIAAYAYVSALVWVSFAVTSPQETEKLIQISHVLLAAYVLILLLFPYNENAAVKLIVEPTIGSRVQQQILTVVLDAYDGLVLALTTFECALLSILLIPLTVSTGKVSVVASAIAIMAGIQFLVLSVKGCLYARHIRQNQD